MVNVYRDARDVFAKASLDTFSKIPITNDHPKESVTASNWREYAVGTTGDEVLRDGEYLKIGLKITDAAAVKAVQTGKRELSVGYTTELVWEDGVAPDGTPYQARQTAIVADHIAIVAQGRAGAKARIGDGVTTWGASPVNDATPEKEPPMTLKTVSVDGIPIEVTDQGATVINTLQQRLADAAKTASDTATSTAALIAGKDKDLATKDAEIDALKAKVVDGAALDKLVADRSALCAAAAKIAPTVKLDGLADADIKKAVVTAKLGDAAVAGKSADYVNARFDFLAEDAAKGNVADPFRTVVQGGLNPTNHFATGAKAYHGMVNDMTNAWQKPAKGAA